MYNINGAPRKNIPGSYPSRNYSPVGNSYRGNYNGGYLFHGNQPEQISRVIGLRSPFRESWLQNGGGALKIRKPELFDHFPIRREQKKNAAGIIDFQLFSNKSLVIRVLKDNRNTKNSYRIR